MQSIDIKFKLVGITVILVNDKPWVNDGYKWREASCNDFIRLYCMAIALGIEIQEI